MNRHAFVLAAAVALVGCAGPRQIAHDREFLQLNAQRDAARANRDAGTANAAEAALFRLAGEAQAAAAAADKDNRLLDAVALYRVAASAAWKSGQGSKSSAAGDGVKVCERLPERDRSAPRDCTFLRMVGKMGSIDQRGEQIQVFSRRLLRTAGADRAAGAAQVRDWALDIISATRDLDEVRAAIEGPGWADIVAPEMPAYADEQVRRGYCGVIRAIATLGRPEFDAQRAPIETALRNSGLATGLAQRRGINPPDHRKICFDMLG